MLSGWLRDNIYPCEKEAWAFAAFPQFFLFFAFETFLTPIRLSLGDTGLHKETKEAGNRAQRRERDGRRGMQQEARCRIQRQPRLVSEVATKPLFIAPVSRPRVSVATSKREDQSFHLLPREKHAIVSECIQWVGAPWDPS